MDVIDAWDGRTACALQAALRMSNEEFAGRLGVAVRTVAGWHQAPGIAPRPEMQRALDTTLDGASDTVRRRFQLLARPAGQAAAQALRVAIAVVQHRGEVLLVCRQDGDDIAWQFPAGIVKPGGSAAKTAVRETLDETGVHCSVRHELGERVHPATGVLARYFLCDWLAGEPTNRDPLENVDTRWVTVRDLPRFIPTDRIYPPISKALEDA